MIDATWLNLGKRMEETKTVKVAAVMTAPRHEITWARNFIERALKESGIPLVVSGGVYYGQCMQTMLNDLVKEKVVDYAVTIDFDTLFTAKDIRRLLRWIVELDGCDAITGIQVRRGKPVMLGTLDWGATVEPNGKPGAPPKDGIEWDGTPVKAATAHFGLTVIDLHKLAEVPKPWFKSEPNAEGEWTGSKVDDDVYFWLKWKEAGNSVYIDPGTRLGHLEEMVAVYDDNMNPTHIYPKQWEEAEYGRRDTQAVETLPGRETTNGSAVRRGAAVSQAQNREDR